MAVMSDPRTIDEWCEAAGIPPAELTRLAGLSRAVVWRHRKGIRPMGELAAIKVEQAMRDAYASRRTDVRPLRREDLCPKLARTTAPVPAQERAA